MIELPYQAFLSGINFTSLLENIKWFLFFVAPIVLIAVALDLLGHMTNIIRSLFGKEDNKNDDDDEYEIKHY